MPDNKSSPVHIDIAARAEARLELRATVPEISTGRFVDAITDLFRPISELQGLKADLIKLQREEVAVKIANVARTRAAIEGRVLVPPPLKVLIPLFEKASQEDISDELIIDVWANLLVSASSENSILPRFISLIGEMNSRQAKLFLDVMEKDDPNKFDETALFTLEEKIMDERIHDLWSVAKLTKKTLFDELMPDMERNGVALGDIFIHDEDGFHSISGDEAPYGSDEEDLDLQVLASLGLLKYVEIRRRRETGDMKHLILTYFIATRVGSEFYSAVSARK
jgi:hypothetical protein